MELAQKIESALVTYLQAQTWPASFDGTEGIVAGQSEETKDGPVIECICGDVADEDPPGTGNYWVPVDVRLKTAAQQVVDVNIETDAFELHKDIAAVLETALRADNLASQLSAAIAAFTVFGVLDFFPQRGQDADWWVGGASFRIYCCGSAY